MSLALWRMSTSAGPVRHQSVPDCLGAWAAGWFSHHPAEPCLSPACRRLVVTIAAELSHTGPTILCQCACGTASTAQHTMLVLQQFSRLCAKRTEANDVKKATLVWFLSVTESLPAVRTPPELCIFNGCSFLLPIESSHVFIW
jgi:hypothetical protein